MICVFPFYFPYLYVNLSIVNSIKSVTFLYWTFFFQFLLQKSQDGDLKLCLFFFCLLPSLNLKLEDSRIPVCIDNMGRG